MINTAFNSIFLKGNYSRMYIIFLKPCVFRLNFNFPFLPSLKEEGIMSSGTVVYILTFILTFQIFAKLRKIIMGKSGKKPLLKLCHCVLKVWRDFEKTKGREKEEHYSFSCSWYQSNGSTTQM